MVERTELLIVERDGPLAVLILNRVERRNALSIALLEAIRTFFKTEAESPQPARAIIIRRKDGALLGALHRPDGRYALLGGAIEEGETPEELLQRLLNDRTLQLFLQSRAA